MGKLGAGPRSGFTLCAVPADGNLRKPPCGGRNPVVKGAHTPAAESYWGRTGRQTRAADEGWEGGKPGQRDKREEMAVWQAPAGLLIAARFTPQELKRRRRASKEMRLWLGLVSDKDAPTRPGRPKPCKPPRSDLSGVTSPVCGNGGMMMHQPQSRRAANRCHQLAR
ncbi:hypothetical protein FICEBENF_01443 [Aeromonas hydrophila]